MTDTVVKWLNDNGIEISKKLADAMAAFEFHNCGTIDDLARNFVEQLVKFTREALQDSDNFYHDSEDKAGVIYNLICENAASHELQAAWDEIEDRLHTINGLDEIDNLVNEVIACAVKAYDISEI